MRFAAFVVVLFAFVVASVGVGEAQTPREREAFSAMARAVQEAGSDSSPRVLAEARRAIERAFSVFEAQESRRVAGREAALMRHTSAAEARSRVREWTRYAEILGQSTAPFRAFESEIPRMYDDSGEWSYVGAGDGSLDRCERDYGECREIEAVWRVYLGGLNRAVGAHWRSRYAAGAAFRGAADGLEGVASGVVGFDVRGRSDLQRLASANLDLIRAQGQVLRAVSECEAGDCPDDYARRAAGFDGALRDLVSAAVAVARGLESYRGGGEVAAEARVPLPAPAVETPVAVEDLPATPAELIDDEETPFEIWRRAVEGWRQGVDARLQVAEEAVSALADVTCGYANVSVARQAVFDASNLIADPGGFPGRASSEQVREMEISVPRRDFDARFDAIVGRLIEHERRIEPRCP